MVRECYGIADGWPVVCEPFTQWVLEDHFPAGRPPLERAGVQLVPDVEPYELMKLRLLNASQQALGYAGYLAGYRYAHEATADPAFAAMLLRYMRTEAVPSLLPVDLAIGRGEIVAVVGPSGCGKSTLLKLVAGLLPPTSGGVQVSGRAVTKPHRDVGIVFQAPLLLPWRNVLANVMMPVEVKRLPRAPHLARAQALLRMTGLEAFADIQSRVRNVLAEIDARVLEEL